MHMHVQVYRYIRTYVGMYIATYMHIEITVMLYLSTTYIPLARTYVVVTDICALVHTYIYVRQELQPCDIIN